LVERKTRLEERKIELEIAETERLLDTLSPSQVEGAKDLVRPRAEDRQGQLLVLRFALLYVVLKLWGPARSALGLLVGGAFLGAQKAIGFSLDDSWILYPAVAMSQLPEVVTWILVIGIGWAFPISLAARSSTSTASAGRHRALRGRISPSSTRAGSS
jgi:hypothetical protein